MNIFKTSRIRFAELYQDAINFLSLTYGKVGQYFTMASPMGQLLQVLLNYGRMILFYIEDSITELNIKTASRPSSVKGLSSLTGHNPSRATAARGTLTLSYNGSSINSYENTITIPNYSQISNQSNGLTYTIILSGEEVRINLNSPNNSIDVNIIQGSLEYQQATGSGDPLQSFNFATKKGAGIDNYFVNVYVNGELWSDRSSILDMAFDEKSYMVKTGINGGIDIFFGNGYNGAVPEMGSIILVEYLVTDGDAGNIDNTSSNLKNQWKFISNGYALNNETVDLNKFLNVKIKNSILFGSLEEPLYLTRLLAPKTSRSFVLANAENYIYFLRKLNMFTVIDAIPGFDTFQDQYALDNYNKAQTNYNLAQQAYLNTTATYGVDSKKSIIEKQKLDAANKQVMSAINTLNAQSKNDNTIYLFLIPDITKRIAPGISYFDAPIDAFKLTSDEKTAILDLIEESGQRVITVDNSILEVKYPKFAINMTLILWEGTIYDTVYENILSAVSDYFLKNTRRDRIPVSDLIRIVENIEGVDSVNIRFDADVKNIDIYENSYGIDDYGDVILTRYTKDAFNNKIPINDIYPLFLGNFTNNTGITYAQGTTKHELNAINIQVRGYTPVDLNNEYNKAITKNI